MGARKTKGFESVSAKISTWSIDSEKRCLEDIDVGIMPLRNDEWSRSKAGYKLLLYMSYGIPCVASPVGINNDIINNGINGYLASTPGEWLNMLSTLIDDTSLREKMGREARTLIDETYSYRVNAPKWIEILTN